MNNKDLNKKITLELDEDLALWLKHLCEELTLMKTINMADKLNAQKLIGKRAYFEKIVKLPLTI